MKIETIDAAVCDRVRDIINNTLGPALEPLGLRVDMKTMRYEATEIRIASFTILVDDGMSSEQKALVKELKQREQYPWMNDLDPDRVVTINGNVEVKLWGYRSRAKKKFMVKDINDNSTRFYPMDEDRVVELFGK
tara:strand:- start:515 stop:919 length:405 start_codon:yes stop_codon:yes gene_type:complete